MQSAEGPARWDPEGSSQEVGGIVIYSVGKHQKMIGFRGKEKCKL